MGYAFFVSALAVALILIPFNSSAFSGAANGMELFSCSVLPSMFPFMCCVGALIRSSRGIPFQRLHICFKLPLYAVFCSLCGTPSSALICRESNSCGDLNAAESSSLCAALTSVNPIFIIGVLCKGFFAEPGFALPFAISHYAPPLLFASAFAFKRRHHEKKHRSDERIMVSPSDVLIGSISDAVMNSLRIGGTIVFFSVLHSVFSELFTYTGISDRFLFPVTALFEMTNGLRIYSSSAAREAPALCAFFMSFGGICLFVQNKLIFAELKAAPYFITKIACGIVSFIIMYLIAPMNHIASEVFSFGGESLDSVSHLSTEGTVFMICSAAAAAFTVTGVILAASCVKAKK